mmetsp:Transcript_149636/g.480389  ORF Transcript_149636/g.480389 Transcript_149636/m.480389 type:complete len:156 (-) Transcript_149636:14-481(-)
MPPQLVVRYIRTITTSSTHDFELSLVRPFVEGLRCSSLCPRFRHLESQMVSELSPFAESLRSATSALCPFGGLVAYQRAFDAVQSRVVSASVMSNSVVAEVGFVAGLKRAQNSLSSLRSRSAKEQPTQKAASVGRLKACRFSAQRYHKLFHARAV